MGVEKVAGLVSLTGDLGEGKAALDLFLKTHKRSPKLFSFFVLDSRGRYMYSMPESLVDRYMQDLSEEDYFRKPAAAGGFYNAGARPDGRGGFELIISVPVYSGGAGKGRFIGVVAERIDLRALDAMFISEVEAGKDSYAFLIDEGGRQI